MPPDMQALTKQLSGIRRALLRVRDAKGHTEQDFHHYQNMLDAIDT